MPEKNDPKFQMLRTRCFADTVRSIARYERKKVRVSVVLGQVTALFDDYESMKKVRDIMVGYVTGCNIPGVVITALPLGFQMEVAGLDFEGIPYTDSDPLTKEDA